MEALEVDFNPLKFGNRVEYAMRHCGLRTNELARKAGLAKGLVSRIIGGKRKEPSVVSVVKLNHALGTRIEWLILGLGEMGAPSHSSSSVRKKIEVSG